MPWVVKSPIYPRWYLEKLLEEVEKKESGKDAGSEANKTP